jgi:hypothetical protein
MRMAGIALVLFALAHIHGTELLNSDLYLSSSRCVRPLSRGFTGYVARPVRSIRNMTLRNVAKGINRGCARKGLEKIPRRTRSCSRTSPTGKRNGTHQWSRALFKDRDHLSEKWETLNPDGTKTHFEFELTRKSGK